MICEANVRLGRNGVPDLQKHPFFKGVDWSHIRSQTAPNVPELKSITDTTYFPTDELQDVPIKPHTGKTVDDCASGKLFDLTK